MSTRLSLVIPAAVLAMAGGLTLDLGALRLRSGQATLNAQTATPPAAIDPVLLRAYQWRSIGPLRGGRSIAVAGVKGRPKEAYFGAVGGGLWKTTDAGENWTPVTDAAAALVAASPRCTAPAARNPDTSRPIR